MTKPPAAPTPDPRALLVEADSLLSLIVHRGINEERAREAAALYPRIRACYESMPDAAAPRGTEPRPDPEVGRVYLAPSQEAVERAVDAYGTSCYQEGVAEALRGPYSPVARILDARKRSDAARAALVALLVGSAASKDGGK